MDSDAHTCGTCRHGNLYDNCGQCEKEAAAELMREYEPGPGDDVPCEKCGANALDTGLECTECGHDNWLAVTGKPFGESKDD